MSEPNENNDPFDFEFENESDEQKEVLDEEGTVDRKVKDRILKSREMVDTAETRLFINDYTEIAKNTQYASREEIEDQLADRWAVVVKQYIRTVRPLLISDEIEDSEWYWQEAPIVDFEVTPRPQKGVDWNRFYHSEQPDWKTAQEQDLHVDMKFEAPDPKRVTINGLSELVDFEPTPVYWDVVLTPDKMEPERETILLDDTVELAKPVYEKAVEYTDEFLQQAGIGLEIGSGDPHGRT